MPLVRLFRLIERDVILPQRSQANVGAGFGW
jgi:hypothetical protein